MRILHIFLCPLKPSDRESKRYIPYLCIYFLLNFVYFRLVFSFYNILWLVGFLIVLYMTGLMFFCTSMFILIICKESISIWILQTICIIVNIQIWGKHSCDKHVWWLQTNNYSYLYFHEFVLRVWMYNLFVFSTIYQVYWLDFSNLGI